MEHTDENIMDPFNIGLYLIEAGLVGVVIYAMMVLPDLFQSMTWSVDPNHKLQVSGQERTVGSMENKTIALALKLQISCFSFGGLAICRIWIFSDRSKIQFYLGGGAMASSITIP